MIVFLASISAALAAVSMPKPTAENSPEKTAVMAIDRAFEAGLRQKADTKGGSLTFSPRTHITFPRMAALSIDAAP